MFAANQTITVINRIYDGKSDTESEVSTVLDGVSVYDNDAASVSSGGITKSGLLKIRIPYSLPDGAQLTIGSTVIWGGRKGTILRSRNNTHRRFAPHWYMEAE